MTDALSATSLTGVERRTVERLARELVAELGDELQSAWLFGSRARGEPVREESDVDVLVVMPRGGWDELERVTKIAWRAAEAEGLNPMVLAVHVRSPEHVAHKRAIRDFFMQEVDRDKIVLAGSP